MGLSNALYVFPPPTFFFFFSPRIKKGTAELDLKHHFSIHEKSSSHYVLNGHLGRFNFFFFYIPKFFLLGLQKKVRSHLEVFEKNEASFRPNDI